MKKVGVQRLVSAFFNSVRGLLFLLKNESAFKQEIMLVLILCPLSFFIGENALEIFLLNFALFFVLIVEVINTAIEVTIDRISLEDNDLSGLAKDLGSAAVFLSIFFAVIVWLAVLLFI